jgi:predicted RNA binding protein YcfA (HicA-like mRNA interferase family)
MPRKVRVLEADLLREGAQLTPGKGSHRKFTHPLVPGHVTLSGAAGDDAQPYQEREVRSFIRRIREARRRQTQP